MCFFLKTVGSKWVNFQSLNEMNEACIWQYIFLGEVGGGEGGGGKTMLT